MRFAASPAAVEFDILMLSAKIILQVGPIRAHFVAI